MERERFHVRGNLGDEAFRQFRGPRSWHAVLPTERRRARDEVAEIIHQLVRVYLFESSPREIAVSMTPHVPQQVVAERVNAKPAARLVQAIWRSRGSC